jgi:UDP-N-acetylglucosamine:LPS N-acetylglucosamine transferase
MRKQMKKRNIVLVGGAGGHGEQLNRIRSHFQNDNVTVIGEPELNWRYCEDKRIDVIRVVDYHNPSKLTAIINTGRALLKTFSALAFKRFDLMISTGPAMAVPVCAVAKILRIRTVHIESWSRIHSISNSTRLIMKFKLADVIAYQYKDHVLAGKPNCEYWGHL